MEQEFYQRLLLRENDFFAKTEPAEDGCIIWTVRNPTDTVFSSYGHLHSKKHYR